MYFTAIFSILIGAHTYDIVIARTKQITPLNSQSFASL